MKECESMIKSYEDVIAECSEPDQSLAQLKLNQQRLQVKLPGLQSAQVSVVYILKYLMFFWF